MRLSLLHQLASEPWFISEPIHAEMLAESLQAMAHIGATAEMDVAKVLAMAFPQRPAASLEKETGIAHIHVFGPLARNLPPLERAMGKTDFAQIHEDFAAAKAAGATGILLHVDSPGGTVNGTPEAAALIAHSPVPVVAHIARGASAAYYLAAGAQKLIASPSAEVGSVGVMMPRVNLSGVMEKLGIQTDTITNTAGDLKNMSADGSLSEVQRTFLQGEADSMFAAFRDHILAHREVPATAMRGQTLSGPAARAANLIDAIGTPAEARGELLKLISAGLKTAA